MMSMLQNGDCLDEMRDLADGCVDSIVTDPPYGINFMGMDFDNPKMMGQAPHMHGGLQRYAKGEKRTGYADCDNAKFQSYMTPIFAEALRVAKPGAHLLAFGGTRTYHRLACAIEDAGWEIRDCIMWVYGCLDEESQILTQNGWRGIGEINVGDNIIGYDMATRRFLIEPCERTYLYDYDDTAYAIQSDCTDQLVSRNHRCIVERGGVEQFALAELVALEREASVPVLESLHGLLDHLPLLHEGASNEKQDLLKGMRSESDKPSTKEAQGSRPERDVRNVRQEVLHAASMDTKGERTALLKGVQWQGACERVAETQQGTPRETCKDREAASRLTEKDDGREQPIMEGRSDVSQASRKLRERAVCEVSCGVSVDGSQGRVCDGTSPCGGTGDRQAACEDGSRASHQSRPAGQQAGESDAIFEQQGAQALRDAWEAKTTLARVTPVHYKGKMWCIKVATGAFVARRHGKIFVTGNSGFPKSMDVSKAIDKMLGAERKVVGTKMGLPGYSLAPSKGESIYKGGFAEGGVPEKECAITAPATPEAAAWSGFGTALKPACEPIVVARKPLEGTVAANVLKYGTGAINIDGCRVPTEEAPKPCTGNGYRSINDKNAEQGYRPNSYSAEKSEYVPSVLGRFPANIVHDGSDEVVSLFPDTGKSTGGRTIKRSGGGNVGSGKKSEASWSNDDPGFGDSGSAARFFYCAKASRKERGEGNIHPTVKPIALMRYLVRLVTRKGGIVLDPFMGSGTTGVAAIQEGMNFVGIERDPHYYEIASERIRKAKPIEQKPKDTQMELPL